MNDDASPPTSLDQWLAELGFVHGNPFATLAADQERQLLPQFYVEVDSYEQIKGAGSIVVFAPRGGGKSALRVVLAEQAFPLSPLANSLAVEVTDFDPLISHYRLHQVLTIEDYTAYLLRLMVRTLFDALCPNPAESPPAANAALLHQVRLGRIEDLPVPARVRLAGLIRAHYPVLLEPFALYERLYQLNPQFEPDWPAFETYTAQRQLRQFVAAGPLRTDPLAGLLAELNDYQAMQSHSPAAPREQMMNFVGVARAASFEVTHVLIDRLDENKDTADNPKLQADIIEPLLANLPILELPGIALKFFLSRETRDELMTRPKIRRDRLTDYAVTVTWDAKRLKQLLRNRLDVYSDGRVQDLIQLFPQTFHEPDGQSLGEWVEADMLRVAQESPRRLLLAWRLLLESHLARVKIPEMLAAVDWEEARKELLQRMPLESSASPQPPILYLSSAHRTARIGDRKISLTKQQYHILIALVQAGGFCDREDLAQRVWGGTDGVSEEAIDRAITRLRNKLGDDANSPIYLNTVYGQGFELKNFELEEN